MGIVRSTYRRLRHGWRPWLRGWRRGRGQHRIQRSVSLRPEDGSDKRRRMHVLVDLIHAHLPGEALRVVEVGTRTGRTGRHVLRYCPQIERLWAIDLAPPPTAMFEGLDRVTFVRGYSDACAKDFEEESVDLVFLDADHSEEWVRRDLEAWLPKVRLGGIVAGHDYGAPRYPGVKISVDRFFQGHAHPVRLEANRVWWTRK